MSECTHNCSTCGSKKNGSCGQDATTTAISEQLAKIKHKIVVLSGGTIVEEGSPKELLTQENGVFRRMAQLQAASAEWSI